MSKENKIYTAADFARYHSSAMSPAEMHALEKAALEDPFLEDALDGYVNTRNAESDIEELDTRLAEKKKKKSIFSISSVGQNKWWRIAALFILIAGAGYIFYRANNSNKENTLAIKEIKQEPAKTQNIPPVATDTVANKSDIAFENQQSSKSQQKERGALPVKPLLEKKVTAPGRITEPSSISKNSEEKSKDKYYTDSIPNKIAGKENDFATLPGYMLKGRITDDVGTPVPYASISDKTRPSASIADASGNFMFHSGDSSVSVSVTAAGFDSKSIRLKKDTNNTIVLNKNNSELTAVIVTSGYGTTKRKKNANAVPNALAEKVAGVQIASSGPQPLGGRQKFNQYIKDSAASVFDENNERATGEVALSFTIDEEGRPKNIEVTRSSCEACEKEAVRLLENGPAWEGKKNDHGNVIIKF
jgi:hypothetical protein